MRNPDYSNDDSHGRLQTLTDTHSFYSRLFGPSSFTLSDHHVRPPMPPCNGIAPRLYTTPFYPKAVPTV